MGNCNAKINRTCQALRTLTVPLITVTKSFLLTVIFLGLQRYYQPSPSRNLEAVAAAHQQESQYISCRTYTGSWKAVRNLSVVASGFLTAILFKMPNDSSPESTKLLLIYPSLVLTTLALTTSTMFIAHFEGEIHHDYLDTRRPSSARSIVFAIPAATLVWGVFLTLAWIAYTSLNTASQFTNVARMGMMWHYASILVPIASVSVAFGTLLVVPEWPAREKITQRDGCRNTSFKLTVLKGD